MRRPAIMVLAFCFLSISSLCEAQEAVQFPVPGRDWSIGLNLPTLDQYQAQSEGGRFKLMAQSGSSGVIVSAFVEPTELQNSKECHSEYWSQASRNPGISKESIEQLEAAGNPSVSYTINVTQEGQEYSAQNINVYIFHDDACVDVHLSVFPARDSGVATLRTIASTVVLRPVQ